MSLLTLRGLFERLRAPSQSQKGHFFRENEAQEMTPKLLALAKVCSVLGNICDVSWHLLRRGSELEKRRTFSILVLNGALKNKACSRHKPRQLAIIFAIWMFFCTLKYCCVEHFIISKQSPSVSVYWVSKHGDTACSNTDTLIYFANTKTWKFIRLK